METNDMNRKDESGIKRNNNSGRVLGGLVLVVIGLAVFARQFGLDIPRWLFSWPMILVAIGLYLGGRQSFRMGGWIAPLLIGLVFLLDNIFDEGDIDISHYLWPSVLVGLGLYMIFKPRKSKDWQGWDSDKVSSDDSIDATAIFGGTKRNIISKNFKGGEISTFFGGTDLDFTQADIQGTAIIQSTTAFGGIKLIVPSHWNLQSEVVCIFGGIDDKRHMAKDAAVGGKTLILKGTCIFGGIDIKSY